VKKEHVDMRLGAATVRHHNLLIEDVFANCFQLSNYVFLSNQPEKVLVTRQHDAFQVMNRNGSPM
jgi:hypothetical protein